jgi:hypothetical protein
MKDACETNVMFKLMIENTFECKNYNERHILLMLENELKVGSLLDNFLRSYYFENECVQNEIIARGR